MEIPIVKRRVIVYNHVTEVFIYSAKTYGDGPFRKIRVYLISRFFSIRENFMLAKYTWFTVYTAGIVVGVLFWKFYLQLLITSTKEVEFLS